MIDNWRVLVVDDEEDSLAIVRIVLEAAHAEVYQAMDGYSALRLFQQTCPNLVLTDISMSKMDGYELLERLRNMPMGESIPILAMTAHVMDGERERGLEAGFDEYLYKPLSMFTLLETLTRCADAKRQEFPPG